MTSWRCTRIAATRRGAGGAEPDFGRTWDPADEVEVYGSAAGDEPSATGAASELEYWNAMGAWQFGHPRGVLLPNGQIFVVFYAGEGATRSARWARVEV